MTGSKDVTSELSRELSLFHITMMGLGMMIGAGVFIGVGNSIARVGPGGTLLTFALNGLIALFTAMSYAELSSAIPRAGGAYNFARIGFGKGTSFVAGWMEWFASSVAGSLYAVTFAIYIVRYVVIVFDFELTPTTTNIVERIVALVIAVFFIYINYRGASETGKIGAFFTLGQTIFLIFIGLVGIVVALRHPSRLSNFTPFLGDAGWGRLLVTMGMTYVAFEGYEVIAQAGDETIDPKRNLPKAMLYSVAIVTVTYVAVAFATVVAVKAGDAIGGEAIAEPWRWIGSFGPRGFGEAVGRLMPAANFLLTLAVVFAATSALNATIYSATRACYALGRDNMLPQHFAKISERRKTPWVALLGTACIVVSVAVFVPTVVDVASSASIMFLLLFFLVNICVIRIRRTMVDELSYGFIMPLFPLFPVAAIIFQAVLAERLREEGALAWCIALVWIAAGVVIYRFYGRTHATTTADEILVLEEEGEEVPTGEGYRVMVAVANPRNALSLVRATYAICEAKEARVELLHMVPVPETVPLSDADKYAWEGREAIVEAMLYLKPRFPLSTTVRYCRNPARGIVSAVRARKIDMLVMGWHGRTRTRGFRLGSTVDPVIERTPCNLAILKNVGKNEFKRILVPLAGGPNSGLALEIASILAARSDGELVALTVQDEGTRLFDIDSFVESNEKRLMVPRERVRTRVVTAADVVEAILRESDAYDAITLGCTDRPLMYQFAVASIPENVAMRSERPVIMVKAARGIRSWLTRWV